LLTTEIIPKFEVTIMAMSRGHLATFQPLGNIAHRE